MVAPAIDGFILDCARKEGVDPQAYGIPSDLKAFTKESKSVTSNTDQRFKSLFAALSDNGEISALRSTLRYLSDSKYSTDSSVLKQLFTTSRGLSHPCHL